MPVVSDDPVVGTTPTLICENDHPATGDAASRSDQHIRRYLIKNVTGTATVYTDGSSSLAAALPSFPWEVADGSIEIELEPGETYYGRVADGQADQQLAVQRQGR